MEEEIEDLVGDVKCTDSQKSVATSNVYSMDFTDSNSDKNTSLGKDTYVIDLDDSDDSEMFSVNNDSKSVINALDSTEKKDMDTQFESSEIYNKLKVSCASTSIPNCSIFAQEIFTQTSKTIIELARTEGFKQDLETQTSIISFSENKTVEYRIELSNRNTYDNDVQKKLKEKLTILSNTLEDESSKFRPSDAETISEVSSEDRYLNIIYDNPKDDVLEENDEAIKKHNTSNCDESEQTDSDIEEDSLMERKKRDEKDNDSNSDISDIPKSVDNEIEELYTKFSESIDFKADRSGLDRIFSPLAPLTEESTTVKNESLMDITPDNINIQHDKGLTENDDVLFTNDAGIKIKMLPDENKDVKLPPIQNRSCPNSPHLNFLFSLHNSAKSKSGTLPCVHEIGRSDDRWELATKDLASGESPLISGRSDATRDKNTDKETIHLPPIHIEGYVVSSKINKSDAQISNVINIKPTNSARDMISINEKIKELKLNSSKRIQNKCISPGIVDSRSCSPSSYTDDTRLYETAERGCDSLCNELLRRLRSTSWFEIVDTLEEVPRVLDKFWGVITEQRIADLIRQVSGHIESPRTQVVRSACNTIAVILKSTNYTKKPDFYEAITLLLTKTGSFSRPVRRAANMALDEIVCGVELTQAVTALCIHGVNHKSSAVRSASARLLVVCCAVHGGARGCRGVLRARPPSAASARAYVLRSLSTLLDDKNTEARKYAERLYSMLRPHTSFEAYYLTDVDVEVASRQMKKYDKLIASGVHKDGR